MKTLFMALVCLSSVQAFGDTLKISGTYNLGQKLFGRGSSAQLTLTEKGTGVEALIESTGTDCVLKFGPGTVAAESSAEIEIYNLPIVDACRSIATNPVKLIVRKNSSGEVTKATIMSGGRYNRWQFFHSAK